jgi:broad specificity phosphatase PhoE
MEVLKILLIRHAESLWNRQSRMQGRGEDDLTDLGKRQVERLANRLLAEAWYPSHIYSSPLKRAQQTTEILFDVFEANSAQFLCNRWEIRYANELQEFQNGVFEGLTWTEAKERYAELCNQLEFTPDWIPIPEAESLQEGRDRAHQFVQTLLQQHHNGDRIWVVTHSWIMQHLIAELLGCDRTWGIYAAHTSLFEFWLDRSRWHRVDQNRFNSSLWQIHRFNDCKHL